MKFTDLGLAKPILDAVTEKGYEVPTPIQAQAIPPVLEGRDVMAAAQTGTGKTAGFVLPILQILGEVDPPYDGEATILIITPTRELAAQIEESVETYGKNLPITHTVVFGGVNIKPQIQKLRRGVDILVATPGRLLDLYSQNAVRFTELEVLVLDEADRMLDMGFIHDIKKILALLPPERQNLLFSATFSPEIRALAKGLVNDPVEISVTPGNTTAELVDQVIYPTNKRSKPRLLSHLIKKHEWDQVLVFTRTKHGANKLAKHLNADDITAAAIHGNKSQGARTKALADFKKGDVQVLVATDIAARGLDISQLPQVINFELPNVSESYIHRIGRTGRAGLSGKAASFVCDEEFEELVDIEILIQTLIPRIIEPGFAPTEPLPESNLDRRAHRYRPKKPKPNHRDGQRSARGSQGNKPRKYRPRGSSGGGRS